ncbi:hypothetical protein [Streptococcus suis]|uniref:hypothetical protein n=1 Tax=Streptococcus suis TaxID=1307 RepID=UPI000044B0B1|nr:hypothetical protein [Streptococcus suis]AML47254.1 hypothetical protein APQ97_09450 [Streptococcus suis]KPA60572.1 hypothetical protein XK23_01595 [Streptococcus suis]MBL1132417.1 hypothetical protein [Streptococcus suis]MBM6437258.1 hypothetical protein [Streptococcus suis]MCH1720697.1 hypothetical protein [Streptococcus suis]
MKKFKKIILWTLGIVASLGIIAYVSVTNHPQLVVGVIQSFMYKESSPNSYSPLYDPIDGLKENGQYLKSEIAYSKDYPASFLLGSEYRTDMVSLNKALKQAGVENELVDPLAEEGLEKPHGFVANLRTDPVSAKAFERLITFIDDRTKE